MRWQFGGNLQPVRMICEIDWRECPSAIINYVWSEIVTDVVDCLTNEWMMWRLIAMLFVCTLLIHTIYSKTRLMDETTINRDNLNVVGFKVQDLELKVNILTYKMQYGTWPLPRQIRSTGVEGGLRNVRLTLTNSNDRNAWLKHMLLSPTENATCVPYAKIGPRSVRCLTKLINLETKYMSSRFSRNPSAVSNHQKSSSTNSEKSLKYTKTSSRSFELERVEKIRKSENFGMRKHETFEKALNRTNNCWSETQVLKHREFPKIKNHQSREINEIGSFEKSDNKLDKSPEERVNTTHETLHRVKEKLENLHSVLRIYGEPKIRENENDNTNKELAESILQDLNNIGNFTTESESERTYEFLPIIFDSNTDESQFTKEEEEEEEEEEEKEEEEQRVDSTSEFEQCHSDNSSSPIKEKSKKLSNPLFEKSENFSPKSHSPGMSLEKIDKLSLTIIPNEKSSIDISCEEKFEDILLQPKIMNSINEERKIMEIDIPITPKISSFTELLKDSDSDDQTNMALLREALKFKNALIEQIELENVENHEKNRKESRSDESESDEVIWEKSKNHYQPKHLDIISEEQSAASSNEKASKSPRLIIKSKEIFGINEKPEKQEIVEPKSSKFALTSESSEYLSLVNSTGNSATGTKDDFSREKIINDDEEDDKKLEKNISDLVNQSVQNIREYIEVFSQMQNEAIVETRRALNDDNDLPCETASLDSITRFVNKIGITMSEELPRKLSEQLLMSLVDYEALDTDDDSPDTDFPLKRNPGAISIAEKVSQIDNQELPIIPNDLTSHRESIDSEDDRLPVLSEISSEPSCTELLMDYLLDNEKIDNSNEKLTKNLMMFDDESRDEERRADSPLTGRTVIRATGSSTSNIISTNGSSEVNVDYEERRINETTFDHVDIEDKINIVRNVEITDDNVMPETSSLYFTDEASLHEIKVTSTVIDSVNEVVSNTWILENKTTNGNEFSKEEVSHKNDNNAKDNDQMEKSAINNEIPMSVDTIVNSTEISSNIHNDSSGTYMDACSRDFLNFANFTIDRTYDSRQSRECKSARESSSSPLQQRVSWTTPRRGTSLNNATTSGKSRKIDIGKTEKSRESLKNVKTKSRQSTRSQSSGNRLNNTIASRDLEITKIDEKTTLNDSRFRRSRSNATPRNFAASPRNSSNTMNLSGRPSRTRKNEIAKNSSDSVKSMKSLINDDSMKSCVSKISKSCIPILRSRLEAVRNNGQEKRGKSPIRCPLTISTSSWSQENRMATDLSKITTNPIKGSHDNGEIPINVNDSLSKDEKIVTSGLNKSSDELRENRTVIYVNIVTEQEQKSATRVVDPKKFLEYLKDRELKVQSVHDREIGVNAKISTKIVNSPRILTIVSSAVDDNNEENIHQEEMENSTNSGAWSLRVEQREIEVSAKPSVIDTSTSISDLPVDTKKTRRDDGKFEIFEVPKELTKDEYIILLEALNQDPNLHQLREMHKLCNKLGLGFHE